VRNVGGLADTVIDTTEVSIADNSANGFVFRQHTSQALSAAVKRALGYYADGKMWRQLQLNAMARDSSWQHSAAEYLALYARALDDLREA
jgi:starch synthase